MTDKDFERAAPRNLMSHARLTKTLVERALGQFCLPLEMELEIKKYAQSCPLTLHSDVEYSSFMDSARGIPPFLSARIGGHRESVCACLRLPGGVHAMIVCKDLTPGDLPAESVLCAFGVYSFVVYSNTGTLLSRVRIGEIEEVSFLSCTSLDGAYLLCVVLCAPATGMVVLIFNAEEAARGVDDADRVIRKYNVNREHAGTRNVALVRRGHLSGNDNFPACRRLLSHLTSAHVQGCVFSASTCRKNVVGILMEGSDVSDPVEVTLGDAPPSLVECGILTLCCRGFDHVPEVTCEVAWTCRYDVDTCVFHLWPQPPSASVRDDTHSFDLRHDFYGDAAFVYLSELNQVCMRDSNQGLVFCCVDKAMSMYKARVLYDDDSMCDDYGKAFLVIAGRTHVVTLYESRDLATQEATGNVLLSVDARTLSVTSRLHITDLCCGRFVSDMKYDPRRGAILLAIPHGSHSRSKVVAIGVDATSGALKRSACPTGSTLLETNMCVVSIVLPGTQDE